MAGTGARMLQLMSLLQTSRHWAGRDLAERLEVSLRTLRRDVDRLRELGYPVEARRGVDGGYQLRPGTSLPPLVLDDDEAVALALGLQAAAQSGVEGMAESSVRALAKVVPVMPRRLRHRVEALTQATARAPWSGHGAAVDPGVLTALAQLCRDAERCTLAYTTRDERTGERHVEPHRLVPLGRRWYLVAYDLDRGDWRTFRLDRVAAARSSGERFAPRRLPADDVTEFVRAATRATPTAAVITATVQAPAGEVRTRTGRWATVTPLDERTCRVDVPVDGPEWALLVLGMTGAEFTVESPDDLRDHLRQWGERFVRAAGQVPAPAGGTLPGAGG
ncbi:helix-turn-helix transcriptional regulator [Kineococcus rubinsiae]|uniref:helix-turn-helix transcriptional regulator n=1 Tax=Kineococcus rubinsiae TaxID=2609562 RepID=UPI00142F7409|nr:YafY family protein [Kineococcus rubinsiae]NIZ92903.1 YafY family transcriptional regulator [Kineococcus rubinsiae]